MADDSQSTPKRRRFRPTFLGIFFAAAMAVFQVVNSQTNLLPSSGLTGWASGAVAVPEPFSCAFRDYERNPDRLYGLTSETYPDPFLRASFYIHGLPPILLPVTSPASGGKVCRRPQKPGESLLMDGSNPTMLSFARLQKELSPTYAPLMQLLSRYPSATYLVSSAFKRANNQCEYVSKKASRKATNKTRFTAMSMPGRQPHDADIYIVDSEIRTLWQTHIWDATTFHEDPSKRFQNASHFPADDLRLFSHDGEIWASYKRYQKYGTGGSNKGAQKITRIRFEFQPSSSGFPPFLAFADPTEEIELCCGRNFGALSQKWNPFIGHEPPINRNLSLVTWPDPVWVQSLDTRETMANRKDNTNTMIEFRDPDHIKSRMPNKKASEFHGTNNQFLYVPGWDEYLGVGHFHRERK